MQTTATERETMLTCLFTHKGRSEDPLTPAQMFNYPCCVTISSELKHSFKAQQAPEIYKIPKASSQVCMNVNIQLTVNCWLGGDFPPVELPVGCKGCSRYEFFPELGVLVGAAATSESAKLP